MRKEIKTIICLLVVLSLIYVQQAVPSQAGELPANTNRPEKIEESTKTPEPIEESTEKPTEEPTEKPTGEPGEKPTGEPQPSEEPTEEPEPSEEPTPTPEPIQRFEKEVSEPDGACGYYITAPKIKITHVSKRGSTCYRFQRQGQTYAHGKMVEAGDALQIPKDWFVQGTHLLEVWMEDENGEKLPSRRWKKTFRVDGKNPEIQLSADGGFEKWHKKEAVVRINATDENSGVKNITCYVNGTAIENLRGQGIGQRIFHIRQTSRDGKPVQIRAEVTDQAGNKSVQEKGLYIDGQAPKVEIRGATDYMITSKPLSVVYRVEEENDLQTFDAWTEFENPKGRKQTHELLAWEDHGTLKRSVHRLREDGIYKLHVEAKDLAGYEAKQSLQVIVDQENPVIQYVDALDQAKLKSFEWNYKAEELVQDFTSYSYEILMDGKLYPMGERITKEGRHVLKVRATDQAGNKSVATATFTIDHTAPEIVIGGVKEGETYEGSCVIQVKLKDEKPGDALKKVMINGKEQAKFAGEKEAMIKLKKAGNYEIITEAIDDTGNGATKRIRFTLKKKKTILDKIVEPFIRSFTRPFTSGDNSDDSSGEKGAAKKMTKEEKQKKQALLLRRIAGTMLGVLLIGGAIYSTSFLKLSKD